MADPQGQAHAALLAQGQDLTSSGMSPQSAQFLLGLGQQNPLVAALIGEEAPSIAQYGQQVAAGEAGLMGAAADLGPNGVENALLQTSTNQQAAQLQNQLAGNQLQSTNVAQQQFIAGGQNQLANQLAATQQGQLRYNDLLQRQQNQSQSAIAGTLHTQGYQQRVGQIQEQYGVSTAELQNQLAGQNLSYTGQNLSSANQQAQLANTAAGLGISQQQLQTQLQQGKFQTAQQLGQTQDQLEAQIAQAQAGETQGVAAIYSNIGALTGLGPQALTSLVPGAK